MLRPEPCPYRPKLTFVLAEEVRRLRRAGASVRSIAKRYGVAPSSITAVLKLHVYAPPEVIALGLERHDRGLLRELAAEDGVSDEMLAADLLINAMDRRVAGREVSIEASRRIRGSGRRQRSKPGAPRCRGKSR